MTKRKIFIITERRADYSRFRPIMSLLNSDDRFDFDLCVTGIHLLEKSGRTINEIINDGFNVKYELPMYEEDVDDARSMVSALGKCISGVSDILYDSRPDIILSGFDIAANLAVTIAGAHMNIPVAHIQGGEVTGTIDESIRHAMSKFSHYHFAANEDARTRLIKMGEKKSHVFNVGCPSIDAILEVDDDRNVLDRFNLVPGEYYLVLQHAVTTEALRSESQIIETIEAIKKCGMEALFILPNNDYGHSKIFEQIKESGFKHIETLKLEEYVNLMKNCAVFVGNSSSGIHETNIFDVPTVNIGTRQNSRLRSNNVIDVDYDRRAILEGIQRAHEIKGQSFDKPYGDGTAAAQIVELLAKIDISENIIQKTITY